MKQKHYIKTGYLHHLAFVMTLLMMIQTVVPTAAFLIGSDYDLIAMDAEQESDEEEKQKDGSQNDQNSEIGTLNADDIMIYNENWIPIYGNPSASHTNIQMAISSPPPDLG